MDVNEREEIPQQQSSDSLEVQLEAVRNSFAAIENKLSDQKKTSEHQLTAKDQIIKDLHVKLDAADARNLQLRKIIKQMQMQMETMKKTHQQDQLVVSQSISFQHSNTFLLLFSFVVLK